MSSATTSSSGSTQQHRVTINSPSSAPGGATAEDSSPLSSPSSFSSHHPASPTNQQHQQKSAVSVKSSSSSVAGGIPPLPRKPFPKALVIHCDPENVKKIFVGLTSKRFCVTTCSTPQEAMKLLKFPPDDFDVIFIDCDTATFSSAGNNSNNDNDDGEGRQQTAAGGWMSSSGGSSSSGVGGGGGGVLFGKSDPSSSPQQHHAIMSPVEFTHSVRVQEMEAQALLGRDMNPASRKKKKGGVAAAGGGTSSSGHPHEQQNFSSLVGSMMTKKEDVVEQSHHHRHAADGGSGGGVRQQNTSASNNNQKSKRNQQPSEFFGINSVVTPPPPNSVNVEKVDSSSMGGSRYNGDDNADDDLDFTCHHLDSYLNDLLPQHTGDDLLVRGATAQKILSGRQSRHVIIGLCSRPPVREKVADLALNVFTFAVESFLAKKRSSSVGVGDGGCGALTGPETTSSSSAAAAAAVGSSFPPQQQIPTSTSTSTALAKARENLAPLFDATLIYPFRTHLAKLESLFVSPDEPIANFLEKPNVQQLAGLLADVTERRVGGLMRVVKAPDWRQLSEAVATGDQEATRTLLHPIPKMVKLEKSARTGYQSGALTIHAIDDGTNDIGSATAHALYRAHADVRRAQDELGLERDSLDATNMELDASHMRNQELVRSIEQSLEDQRRLEDEVKFFTDQLGRKEREAAKLRKSTEEAFEMAQKMKSSYDRLCELQAHDAATRQKQEEETDHELRRVRHQQNSNNNSNNNQSSRGKISPTTKNSSDPLARSKNPNTTNQGGRTVQANIGGRHPLPPSSKRGSRSRSGGSGSFSPRRNAAFRAGHTQFLQKQEARCVEVDIGLDTPLYLDLLSDARSKCLEFMQENVELREEVFQCHSIIHYLRNQKLAAWEGAFAAGTTNLNASMMNNFASSMRAGGGGMNAATASSYAKQKQDNFFASFRRLNQKQQQQQQQSSNGNGNTSGAGDDDAGEKNSNNNKTSRTNSIKGDEQKNSSEKEEDAACFVLGIAHHHGSKRKGSRRGTTSSDDFLLDGDDAAEAAFNDADDVDELREQMKLRTSAAVQRAAASVKENKRMWRCKIERASEKYESNIMAVTDALSCVTVNDNVLNLVKDGVRFKTSNYDYSSVREVRCRAGFSDDTVHGALATTSSSSSMQQNKKGARSVQKNPMVALDESIVANNNNNAADGSDTATGGKKQQQPAVVAVNVTRGGTGGTAAAVIHNLIISAQKRSQEPVRDFLRQALDVMWTSVKTVSQSTLLDVMTTHAAIGHGLDRLVGTTAMTKAPVVTTALRATDVAVVTSSSSSSSSSSQQQQQQKKTNMAASLGATSSAIMVRTPTPPTSSSPSPLQQQQNAINTVAAVGGAAASLSAPTTITTQQHSAKQQQLAQSLRRLFLDRLMSAMNRLFDGLAEKFSENIYTTYYGAAQVMEEQIHMAIHPLALENARLATALLIARTAAHRHHSNKNQRDGGGDGDGKNKKGSSSSADEGNKNKKSDVDDFEKTVTTRDGWCQTRPVMIRDPLVDDIA